MAYHYNKLQRTIGIFPTSKKTLLGRSKSPESSSELNDNNDCTVSGPQNNQFQALSLSQRFSFCVRACLYSSMNKNYRICSPMMAQSLVQSRMNYHKIHPNSHHDLCKVELRDIFPVTAVKPTLHICKENVEGYQQNTSDYKHCHFDANSFPCTDSDLRSTGDNSFLSQNLYSMKSHSNISNIRFFSTSHHRNSEDTTSNGKGPTQEQLDAAQELIYDHVMELLQGPSTIMQIIHPDIIFENNLQGKNRVTSGSPRYIWEISKLRFKIHAQNTQASIDVLHVNVMPQTGVIRVHWKLTGVSQVNAFKFWLIFSDRTAEESIEAFTYFHIGKDGLIHKIRIDRHIPDESNETAAELKAKLARMLNPNEGKQVMCV